MYFSSFQAYAQAWLPDSPLSSACSSITVELYFVISLSSSCRDAALLYSSCSCIVALGFTHILLRHPSVLMRSQSMFSRPNSPSRLSPSRRKYQSLPQNLRKTNTSQNQPSFLINPAIPTPVSSNSVTSRWELRACYLDNSYRFSKRAKMQQKFHFSLKAMNYLRLQKLDCHCQEQLFLQICILLFYTDKTSLLVIYS